GRRIPFIVATAPFLCVFLVLLGYSGPIGDHIRASGIASKIHIPPMLAILFAVGFLIAGFQFFNIFLNSLFGALFADVVPKTYYARFSAFFGFVGSFAAFIFSTFVFPYAETRTKYIYWGAALLYVVGFSILCTFVKEGQYPPPEDMPARNSRFEGASVFFREC